MAGFEVVVRPVVFPDIRPAPAQPVPPADDPDKGFATINGNGGKSFTLQWSYNSSGSTSQRFEKERVVDEARVYQKEKNGKINKKNFVDIKAAKKIKMNGPPSDNSQNRPSFGFGQGPMAGAPPPRPFGPETEVYNYKRMKAEDNVEILRLDVVEKKGQEASE